MTKEYMTFDQVGPVVDAIMTRGPDRVIITEDGKAVSSRRARERYHVRPDLILIRNDGWSLGAPDRFVVAAFAQWPAEWIAYVIRPSTIAKDITEWPQGVKGWETWERSRQRSNGS